LEKLDHHKEAIREYGEVIKLNKKYVAAYANLVNLFIRMGDKEKAMEAIQLVK